MRGAGLSREVVVRAAVQIADADGIDALSMRRLSQRLGVTPMAIYRYLPDKSGLVDVVIDESLRVVPLADPSGPLMDELSHCLNGLYELLRDHPGLARAVGDNPMEGPVAAQIADRVLELLQRNGMDDGSASDLLVAAFSLTLGCALYRSSRAARTQLSKVGEEAPAVHRVRDRLAMAGVQDAMFRGALERLVAGYLGKSTPRAGWE